MPPNPPMPPQGPGWDSNPEWAPPPGPGPDPGWAPGPAQQPPGPPGWQPQPPGYGTPPPGMPGGAPVAKNGPSPILWVALVVVVVAAAVGAYFVFAGGSDDSGPEAAVRSYYNAAVDGDCSGMLDVIDLSAAGMSAEELTSQCEQTYGADTPDLGEIPVPTELVSTRVVSESDTTATVTAEYRMSDDTTDSVDLTVNNTDDGWRVDITSFGGGGSSPPDTGGDGDETTTTESDSTTTTEDESDDTTTTTESSSSGGEAPPLDTEEGNANPTLEGYAQSCSEGDMAACDDLWAGTAVGSELEAYAEICGGRAPSGGIEGDCEELYG